MPESPSAPPRSPRHTWGEPNRALYKTERQCSACGLVKVTVHEPHRVRIEWWHELVGAIASERTPPCERPAP